MKKIILGLGLALILTGCQQSTQTNNEPLKIGGIAPLTGDAVLFGMTAQNAANLAVEEINADGGINGRMVEMIWEDGKCTPGEASKAAQKLIGIDKVSVIYGGVCSGETLGAAPITEKNKVILFSPISTSPEVSSAGDYVFRTAPSDSSQGKALADYANKNFEKIGMIVEQTDYAFGVANTFEENFTGETIRENYLDTESDFKTRITKLKNAEVDALLLIPQSPPKFEIIAKQIAEQEWDKPLLLNEVATGNLEGSQKYAELLTSNNTVGANFVEPGSDKFQSFLSRYETKYGKKPELMNYAATSSDAIATLLHVLGTVDDPTDTESIKNALYNLEGFDGVYGPIVFDENGDINITHQLFSFDGEKYVPLEN